MPKEKKETTGRSSEEQKIGNAKQPDMKETGKYEIEKEIEAEKQIDTFHEGDGKACTTSETEVQKPLYTLIINKIMNKNRTKNNVQLQKKIRKSAENKSKETNQNRNIQRKHEK
ncbi:uncharacterized protein [Spinacia oleracea]|uniref:Uncharacterized protein isoform X2 n=1 Tax=Spinacia oleracea TaxID=3562 RepID=A0ABM3RNL9_SPIOL|nr:uncharacterized protein LOC130470706 isoform X2 [Spinacia oleracea]